MLLYGLRNCDACRKALKELGDVEFRDVREDGVPGEVYEQAFAQLGKRLINTRSTTWRGLSADEQEMDPVQLLVKYPTVMKRPLIQYGETFHVGWTPEVKAKVMPAS
ncbi:MAG: ArsC/Spx/MgsR family protein [Pseudomonadota bacterium]